MGTAYAHGLYAPTPDGFFELKWAFDPTLIFFVVMAILYWRGLRAFRGKAPVKRWQIAAFIAGVAVLIAAYVPPIDKLSDQLFFMHMVQHLLITQVGVPLLIFGVPFYVTIRGISPWVRRNIYFPVVKNRGVRGLLSICQQPIVAVVLYEATFWFWHIPKYYNMALLNDAIHLLEHACMAFAAINLWRILIDPYPLRSPLKLPLRILALGFLTALDVALSAALTYADTVWYAYEGLPLPSWWVWSHNEDQRLGGLLMWIVGGMIWFIAMTATFFVWAHKEQEKDRRLQAKLAADREQPANPAPTSEPGPRPILV